MPQDNPNQQVTIEQWEEIVRDRFKIPKGLWQGMASQESGGKWNATSPTGVRGKYQVTERTAKGYGLDRNDPYQQVVAAARTLRDAYDSTTDVADDRARWLGAVGKYYGGPNAVDKAGNLSTASPDGVSNPATHVERVAKLWGDFERQGGRMPAPAPSPAPAQAPAPEMAPIRPVQPKPVQRNPQRGPLVTPLQRQVQQAQANPFSFTRPTGFEAQAAQAQQRTAQISPDVAARADAAGRELTRFQNRSRAGQAAEVMTQGVLRGAEQVAKTLSYINPNPTAHAYRGQSLLTPAAQQNLQAQEAAADVALPNTAPIARGVISAAVQAPLFAGAGQLGTAGAVAAGAGMAAANEDWSDPKKAALRTAIGAVAPIAGARIAQNAIRPATMGGRLASGTAGGALGNVLPEASAQIITEGRLDPQRLGQQAVIGGITGVATPPGNYEAPRVMAERPQPMTRLTESVVDPTATSLDGYRPLQSQGGNAPIRPDRPQQTRITKIPTGAEYSLLSAEPGSPVTRPASGTRLPNAAPQAEAPAQAKGPGGLRFVQDRERIRTSDKKNIKWIEFDNEDGTRTAKRVYVPDGMTPSQAKRLLTAQPKADAPAQAAEPGTEPLTYPGEARPVKESPRGRTIQAAREIELQSRAEADAALQEGRLDDARRALISRLDALRQQKNNVAVKTPGAAKVHAELGRKIFDAQEELRSLREQARRTPARAPQQAAAPQVRPVQADAPTRDITEPLTPDAPKTAQITEAPNRITADMPRPMPRTTAEIPRPASGPVEEPTNRLRETDYPGGELRPTAGMRVQGQDVEIPAARMQENTNRLPGAEYAGGEVRRGATGPVEGVPVEMPARRGKVPAPERPAGRFRPGTVENRFGPSTMSAAFPSARRGLRFEGENVAQRIGAGEERGEYGKLASYVFKSTSGKVEQGGAHGQDSFLHDPDTKGALGLTRDAEMQEVSAALKADLTRLFGVESGDVSRTYFSPETLMRWADVRGLGQNAREKLRVAIEKYQRGVLDNDTPPPADTPDRSQPESVPADRKRPAKTPSDFQRFREANAKVIASLESISAADAAMPGGKRKFDAAANRLRKSAKEMGIDPSHAEAIITDAMNAQIESARRADAAPRPSEATPAQRTEEAPRFAGGDRVEIAEAQFDVVRTNADGSITLRNDQGDTWEEAPSASWRKIDAPTKKATASEAPEASRRDAYIEARQREQLETARAALAKARQAIQEHLQKAGVKLPVGISAEQYLSARVGEAKRPNKDLAALKRQLDGAQESVARAEKEMADTTGGLGSTRYTHGEVHRRMVESAIAKGKPVPAEVLADYPDLAPKTPAAPPARDAQESAAVRAYNAGYMVIASSDGKPTWKLRQGFQRQKRSFTTREVSDLTGLPYKELQAHADADQEKFFPSPKQTDEEKSLVGRRVESTEDGVGVIKSVEAGGRAAIVEFTDKSGTYEMPYSMNELQVLDEAPQSSDAPQPDRFTPGEPVINTRTGEAGKYGGTDARDRSKHLFRTIDGGEYVVRREDLARPKAPAAPPAAETRPRAVSEAEAAPIAAGDAGKAKEPLPSDAYAEARKTPNGKWQLFYRGTRNEVFPGEAFQSAAEAKRYLRVKRSEANDTPAMEPPAPQAKRAAKAKPAKPAPPAAPEPAAAKPAGRIDGKDVTADEMAVLDAMREADARTLDEGGAVSFSKARKAAGLSKEAFDAAVLRLADKEILALHPVDSPHLLGPESRARFVKGESAEYIGGALRNPRAKVERAGKEGLSFGKLDREESGGTTLGSGFGALQGLGKYFRRDTPPPQGADLEGWMDSVGNAITNKMSDADIARIDDAANKAADAAEAGDAAGWKKHRKEVEAILAEQTGMLTKLSTFRKAAMLSRPVTHLKNVIGNTAFQAMEEASRLPGAGADAALSLITGRRAHGGVSPREVGGAIYTAATDGVKRAARIMKTGVPQDVSDQMQHPRVTFKSPLLNKATDFVFRALAAEDEVFFTYAYDRAMREQARLMANAEVKSGTIHPGDVKARRKQLRDDPDELMEAEALAAAEVAVFRNKNKISSGIQAFRGEIGEAGNFALDFVLPFDRTPTNIILRALEYTPAGYVKNVAQAAKGAVRTVKETRRIRKEESKGLRAAAREAIGEAFTPQQQREFAQVFGRATTGTSGVITLGYALAAKGMMTGFYDDEDQRGEAQRREMGAAPGSIKIGGRWYNLSGLPPVGMLLALGATIHREMHQRVKDEEDRPFKVAKGAAQMVMEIPALRGTKEAYNIVDQPGNIGQKLGRMAGTFVPGAVADIGTLTDRSVRDTRAEGKKGMAKAGTQFVSEIAARVPVARWALPAKRVGGEPEPTEWSDVIDPFASKPARDVRGGKGKAIKRPTLPKPKTPKGFGEL